MWLNACSRASREVLDKCEHKSQENMNLVWWSIKCFRIAISSRKRVSHPSQKTSVAFSFKCIEMMCSMISPCVKLVSAHRSQTNNADIDILANKYIENEKYFYTVVGLERHSNGLTGVHAKWCIGTCEIHSTFVGCVFLFREWIRKIFLVRYSTLNFSYQLNNCFQLLNRLRRKCSVECDRASSLWWKMRVQIPHM